MRLKQVLSKISIMITLLTFLTLEVIPVIAAAQPHPRSYKGFKQPPMGSQRVYHGKSHYIYHGGRFYRPGKAGYVFTRPPVGVVVHRLPILSAVVLAGLTYYVYDNIYYRKAPTGYVVVETPQAEPDETVPADTVIQVAPGTSVSVNVQTLNVRSGPNLNDSVKAIVSYGDQLIVEGSSREWFYVRLPNGSDGWVMIRFVRVPNTGAKG